MCRREEQILTAAVIAVVTFGDPSHMVNQSWDEGTSNHDGVRFSPPLHI